MASWVSSSLSLGTRRANDQDRRFVKLPSPRDGRYLVSGKSPR
jgi:hypothetical protein